MAIVKEKIYSGDTLRIDVADNANAQMTLTNAQNTYNESATLSGDIYEIHFSSAKTANFVPGKYRYSIFEMQGSDRTTLQTGFIEVIPNFANVSDQRCHVEKVLDAIEATLEGKASLDHETATINGRSIKRFTPEQLLFWRDKYRAEMASIKRKQAIEAGTPHNGIIRVKF